MSEPAGEPRKTGSGRGGASTALLAGLLAAALAAVAGAKPWAELTASGRKLVPGAGSAANSTIGSAGEAPLALALALVALAGWGAILVTRGRFRTVIAAIGTAAAAGLVVVAVVEFGDAPDSVRRAVGRAIGGTADGGTAARTGWYWVGLVAAVVLLVSYAVAVRRIRRLPSMSSRYDAPGGAPQANEPTTNLEIWKAIDAGEDPTEDQSH